MKKYLFLLILTAVITVPLNAAMKSTMIVDTPTAYTIGKGTYQLAFTGYDGGGMELKTFIGLHDNVFLGVSFDVQNMIGRDEPKPNIPGVVARIKFTDGWESFPLAIAIGYDSFYLGKEGSVENPDNDLNHMIYGPYIAFSRPVYMFDDEQYVSFGIRMPTQPHFVPVDTAYYINLDVPMGMYFHFKTEIGKIYWDLHRPGEWMYNLGFQYCYLDQLGLEFDILFRAEKVPNRIIKVFYHGEF